MDYKNFFDACKINLYFYCKKGILSTYDLFKLPIDDLKDIYVMLKQKAVVDDDPILSGITSNDYKTDLLRFKIVKDILLYKQNQAKKNELLAKKKQLEKMLADIKLKRLQDDPDAITKELDEINESLKD